MQFSCGSRCSIDTYLTFLRAMPMKDRNRTRHSAKTLSGFWNRSCCRLLERLSPSPHMMWSSLHMTWLSVSNNPYPMFSDGDGRWRHSHTDKNPLLWRDSGVNLFHGAVQHLHTYGTTKPHKICSGVYFLHICLCAAAVQYLARWRSPLPVGLGTCAVPK